jgi:hypothetical protein
MDDPQPNRFEQALYKVVERARLQQLALGSGLAAAVSRGKDVRRLQHNIREGVPTRDALHGLTDQVGTAGTVDLDLDLYDPWLDSLDEEQLALYRSGDLRRPLEGNIDLLAYYLPFHQLTVQDHLNLMPPHSEPTWGIYLITGGVERLAREAFLPAGYGAVEALQAAARALYTHELFHFLTEVAITAVELSGAARGAVADHYLAHQRAHASYCEVEEGLANRQVLRLSNDADRTAIRTWMSSGPPGYRDFACYEDPLAEQAGLREVLAHACGCPAHDLPSLAELAFDLGSQHVGVAVVPLHLEVTPGSAFEAGAWSWPGTTEPASATP